ncbi:MAG TPA: hypothetical protein VH247_01375 [Thermoleophilaceae bacterium]|jgi:hypothetical protein|nr:hypothetical protein [Thermoleophilaceae bacterium]
MSSHAAGSPGREADGDPGDARPDAQELRVLFCIGVLPDFYSQPAARFDRLMTPFFHAFDRLGERFGLRVLGTLDDVHLTMGPTFGWPWTCYILAAAPDLDAIRAVAQQLMEVEIEGDRLWRYAKLEARIGPPLDFGTT